jgi:hypothetical protein
MEFKYNKPIDYTRGNQTWKMFNDFWGIIKNYTEICEDDDKWLKDLEPRLNDFAVRNKCEDAFTTIFAVKLANAFLEAQGETLKGLQGKRTELDEIY